MMESRPARTRALADLDLQTFADRGLVKVPGLIPVAPVQAAREHVYRRLERANLWVDGRWAGDADAGDAGKRLKAALKGCSKTSLFADLLTPEVIGLARQLAGGEEVTATAPLTQLLFTPPNAVEWSVPATMWHVDYPRLGDVGWAGVQMFTFLDTVAPGGGGTLQVAGSHRLLNDVGILPSKGVRRRLAREEYFRALTDKRDANRMRFLEDLGHVDGVPLQVVELTGEPGDVYFVDLRLLHSLGPNAADTPRMMVTQRLPRASIAEQMRGVYAEVYAQRQAARARKRGAELRP